MTGAADGVFEGVVLDGDHDLGFGGGWGGSAGCGGAAAELDEGFGAAPVGRAQVAPGGGVGGRDGGGGVGAGAALAAQGLPRSGWGCRGAARSGGPGRL